MASFRIYRANRDNNGNAIQFETRWKEDKQNKYGSEFLSFLTAAKQMGVNDNGDGIFGWKPEQGVINCKLGLNDLGEMISVLEGRKDFVGSKGTLFHETPGGGNKVIGFSVKDNGYNLKVSAQDKDKNKVGEVYVNIKQEEASNLLVFLRKTSELILGF